MFHVSSTLALSLALSTTALIACQGDDVDSPLPDSSLSAELRGQPSYEIDVDGVLSAEAAALRIDRVSDVEFEVGEGHVVLAVDDSGDLSLVDLLIDLGDVTVPTDIFPPSGLELTNIQIELGAVASAPASWNENGSRVEAQLSAELVLHWSTRRDGRDIPLADIHVAPVALVAAAERIGGDTTISIGAESAGAFWSWAQTFELRDLDMVVSAR